MALRLRRGTNAERLTITPEIGELIYTTDTKKVFVGDGTTEGGVAIDTGLLDLDGNSLNDLGDVSTATPTDSQVLAWNDANSIWEPADAATPDLSASVISDLGDVAIGVIDINQTLIWDGTNFVPGSAGGALVDETTPTLGGDLDANSNNIINVNQINASTFNGTHLGSHAGDFSGDLIGSFQGSVFGGDSSVMINSEDNSITADTITAETVVATEFTGDVIGNVTGNLTGDILADDGITKVINVGAAADGSDARFTGITEGLHRGNVEGDVLGSVFADDSTLIIDGTNGGAVNTTTVTTNTISVNEITADNMIVNTVSAPDNEINFVGSGNASRLAFERHDAADPAVTDTIGRMVFTKTNTTTDTVTSGATIDVNSQQMLVISAVAGTYNYNNYLKFHNSGKVAISMGQAAINNAPDAHLEVGGSIKPGVYADAAARDAAITAPTAGEMIFVTDDGTGTARFQGYDGASWVNLNT